MTYKGYTALLEVDVPSGTIVGHVIGIRDEIVFQGKTTDEAVEGFHQAVDFYLSRLAAVGQKPERPFSGRFNVRIDPDMHRALVLDAEARLMCLNDIVKQAFAAYLAQAGTPVQAECPAEISAGQPGHDSPGHVSPPLSSPSSSPRRRKKSPARHGAVGL
jgi:predicted HicB family RNase H-like nuclease